MFDLGCSKQESKEEKDWAFAQQVDEICFHWHHERKGRVYLFVDVFIYRQRPFCKGVLFWAPTRIDRACISPLHPIQLLPHPFLPPFPLFWVPKDLGVSGQASIGHA